MLCRNLAHYLIKLVEIAGGALFLSKLGQRVWRARLSAFSDAPAASVRLAMVAHVYYPDLLPEVLDCRRAIGDDAPLFVTTAPDQAERVGAALAGVASVFIRVADNRGRDIAPFLLILNQGDLDAYDVVLKIHTKRSPHLRTGELRRRLLYKVLAGSRPQVARIAAIFKHSPDVGIVGWGASYRRRPSYWGSNRRRVENLVSAMSPGSSAALGFFEGSMFWFRPAALAPLRRLQLDSALFEPEEGQLDGALHHAIERLFPLAAATAGFKTVSVSNGLLTPSLE